MTLIIDPGVLCRQLVFPIGVYKLGFYRQCTLFPLPGELHYSWHRLRPGLTLFSALGKTSADVAALSLCSRPKPEYLQMISYGLKNILSYTVSSVFSLSSGLTRLTLSCTCSGLQSAASIENPGFFTGNGYVQPGSGSSAMLVRCMY